MSDAFINKNVKLSLEFDDYLVKHPDLFAKIPNCAYIVITVSSDKKFSSESLSLIRDRRHKKVVEAHKSGSSWRLRPLPLAAA